MSALEQQIDVDDDEVLTVDEVAVMFKVPKSWVYEHVRRRAKLKLPSFKVGHYDRFWRSEVRAFFRKNRKNVFSSGVTH